MKRIILLLLLACFALCAVPACAITVTPPSGIPTGDLTPGTRLSIETTVSDFIGGSGTTFPMSDTLQLYTDLDSPRWTVTIVLDGIDNPRPVSSARTHRISGFELEYPSSVDLKVIVNLEGEVPDVTATGDKEIIRIRQIDSSDRVRSNGEFVVTRTVLNPAEVKTAITSAKGNLEDFRTKLDAAKDDGVDTSAVETKYNSARNALESATAAGDNVGLAQSYLSTARTALTEGEELLEETVVQHAISSAEDVLADLDDTIDYFTANRSMGSDSRVVLISSKRQSVKNQIDTAKGNYDAGHYSLAERQANDALDEGKNVLAEARDLREQVESLPVFVDPGKPYLWVVLGAAVIGAVGFVVIKKRRTWDELG
ncbi:MAG: hypothetical protein D5R99_01060 [Methanocalculus sp. MSAO_Arc1]|uniref:hypothetical protein n=1 Tax=Methanocalculus TaxID=71151 RepID=UPI000FF44240|nr:MULTISPECIES: hypothetical protein [unclassified Methanocalculus]MCP1663076.1 hypothetical protein [Methanocalculus sp. AMF5]RQD81750.1 MAG: hypothetical protein D5R99_01060 [Methanocalculus sp. MSAO_Arc1]